MMAVSSGQKAKRGAVKISHLRLEHGLTLPRAPLAVPLVAINPKEKIRIELQHETGLLRRERLGAENDGQRKRIREINRIIEGARKAKGGSVDSGLTALKLGNSPMGILLGNPKHGAGAEELMAAQEIETAFVALSQLGGLNCKSPSLEKRDRGHSNEDWDWRIAEAVRQYQIFAWHWSDRKKQDGNPMLEIVVAAVVDQRGFRQIEQDMNLRNGSAPKIVVAGLRDYAARARWVDHRLQAQWKAEASNFHKTSRPKVLLSLAIQRAREVGQV